MEEVILGIVDKDVTLRVLRDSEEVARDAWVDSNNLLEEFFPRFEKVCESAALSLSPGVKYTFEGDLSKGYTTIRIGKTIMNTLTFATNCA